MEENITCFIACSEETNLNDIIKVLPECRNDRIPWYAIPETTPKCGHKHTHP